MANNWILEVVSVLVSVSFSESGHRWTTARRGSPISQLKCVGGSANCKSSLLPQSVQCYNRGSDGVDVQWECKADLQNNLKFGSIIVSCEGYDYPDDPYVLKGSCGLEYSLEYTGSGGGGSTGDGAHPLKFTDVLFFGIVLLFVYAIYKTCVSTNQDRSGTYGSNSGYPGGPGGGDGGGNPGHQGPPPPYGWNPGSDTYDSCSQQRYANAGPAPGVGGFWTGLGAGGLLGYLFGRNRNDYVRTGYGYDSFGGGTRGFGGGSGASTSSGTRTASGFGGTRRR